MKNLVLLLTAVIINSGFSVSQTVTKTETDSQQKQVEPEKTASYKIALNAAKNKPLVVMSINNESDLNFYCENVGDFTFYYSPNFFEIPAHSETSLIVRTENILDRFLLPIRVHNLIDGADKTFQSSFQIEIIK